MTQKFFDLLNHVFLLMSENKLRKDIDDTLLEKLLTVLKEYKFQPSLINDGSIGTDEKTQNMHFDFIEELLKRTAAKHLIERVLRSVTEKNGTHTVTIKAFGIRLLGLIYESPKELFSHENLIPLLRDKNNGIISDHFPSIQDALIVCLSSITKQLKGALWFIDHNLEEFVFSIFNSTSYYVRKSAISFFVDFVTKWAQRDACDTEERKTQEFRLKEYLRKVMSYIVKHIPLYRDSKEMDFSECCILVTKQLLKLENSEEIMGSALDLGEEISKCFLDLPEEERFNSQLIDFFLTVSFESKSAQVATDVIKYLIMKKDLKLAFNLASSYANIAWRKNYHTGDVKIFLFSLDVLRNEPLIACNNYFQVDERLIYDTICKKMENRSDCKLLFCLSLSAIQKLLPYIPNEEVRRVAEYIIEVIKSPENPECHKWICAVLEDRSVHHSLVELLTSFLSGNVQSSFIFEGSDLVFEIMMELIKKPTSDNNFLSQLLLLVKDLLILHEKLKFDLRDADKDILIEVLCRMLLDNRESVVDNAIHLAGQILNDSAPSSWQEKVSKHSIHSIIWDIAIHGSHDGSVRSTALKVVIEGCLESWCLDELKSLKGVTEIDIVKILFDLTYDRDFFLQREALSCLFLFMKSKWNDLPPSSKEYLFSALVSAVKSLDLELKLTSLDVWLWLIKHKFTSSGNSSEVKKYIENLTDSGCGLSLILAFEDYDEAVKLKAANILLNLKEKLIINSVSIDLLNVNSPVQEPENLHIPIKLQEPFTLEERDEGIDSVMEISTTDQITKICRPPSLSDMYDFKQEYFSVDSRNRKCSVSLFWRYLWSEDLVLVVHPSEMLLDINLKCESLLNDIIAAKVSDLQPIEETLDCY